jgi:hypothetical protein
MKFSFFLLFLSLFALAGFGQDNYDNYKKVNQFMVPNDLLDPAYPVLTNTGDPVRDAKVFEENLRMYTKLLGKLPQYVYTGDVVKDQANYDQSIQKFLEQHPYFPQPILTTDPQRDVDVFEALWKGYMKYFPDKAKRIIVNGEGGVK